MVKAKFFNAIKESLFKGSFTQPQVDNINALINEYRKYTGLDYRHLAYILATCFHETAATMQPIREYGLGKAHDYGKMLDVGQGPGKRVPYLSPNHLFYGRGHVQNTWYSNYLALTKANKMGWDFVNFPDLLLQVQPSAWATLHGMVTGLYTGRKLHTYINDAQTDFVGARYIINGNDKAELIAGYAQKFYNGLIQI